MSIERESPTVERIRRRLGAYGRLGQAQARTMQPDYYTSQAFFELEKELLFRQQWNCVGHAGEIPNPGDYFTTDLVEEPLLILHDQNQRIRIFSNVCRHRANIVARGAGNARRFVCGYHAWTYGLDGRLLAAPLLDQCADFRKGDYELPSLHCETWNGFIFVNLGSSPTALAPSLRTLEPHIRNYHIEERVHLYQTHEVWDTNWKSVAENFMEGYHLSTLHAKSLHDMTPTALCEKIPTAEAYTAYKSHINPKYPDRGPFHPDLTEAERRYSVLFCVYPALLVGVAPNATVYLCLRPLTAASTAIRWGLAGVAQGSTLKEGYLNQLKAAFLEDRLELEKVQKGMQTRFYDHGPLAPQDFEGTVWDMVQYMSKQLGLDEHTPDR
jgi:choline monooxygenase